MFILRDTVCMVALSRGFCCRLYNKCPYLPELEITREKPRIIFPPEEEDVSNQKRYVFGNFEKKLNQQLNSTF